MSEYSIEKNSDLRLLLRNLEVDPSFRLNTPQINKMKLNIENKSKRSPQQFSNEKRFNYNYAKIYAIGELLFFIFVVKYF